MTTLAELAEMLNALVHEVEYLDPLTYSDTLEGVEGAFEVKAEKVVYAIEALQRRAALMKEQQKRFNERIHTVESNERYLRKYLMHALLATGKRKLETPAFTMRLQKSQRTVIDREEDIPSQLKVTKLVTSPDKVAIKKSIQAGEVVPGAHIEAVDNLIIAGTAEWSEEHGELK